MAPEALTPAGGEAQRLLELRRLGILDSAPEESFDRIARLAARALGMPAATISLVDEHRVWLKSRIGVSAKQLPRESSFAAYVVDTNRALIIPDASADARFAVNPLVTGGPQVRAWLGVPLHTRSGQPIGSLSAMDTKPRTFSTAEIEVWSDFGKVIEDIIQVRELAVESDRLARAAKASELKHTEVERRLQRIADSIPALIGYWNTELRCEFANDAYRTYSGLTPQQMIGLHFREVLGEKFFAMNSPHAFAALAGEPQRFQRRVIGQDGTPRDTEGQYLPDRDENGEVRGFFVLVTDVTELATAKGALELSNAKLLKESTTDFLTGLANRRVFTERCDAAAAAFRKSGRGYALILLDLDNFKHINDSLGHDNGDKVLQAAGEILGSQLRERDDLAARLGGEEFAILCGGEFTEASLQELAGRIRTRINKATVSTPKGVVSFTSSFGIARCNPDDTSWTETFARADAALYEAKESGKDRIVFGHSAARGTTGRFRSMGIPPVR
ncbi:MAG TPA: diguanylate cyclase [Steroidobacteraceae bacterium]|nr:diguanylate cyclase [Steroidobacteraceae bacterium]